MSGSKPLSAMVCASCRVASPKRSQVRISRSVRSMTASLEGRLLVGAALNGRSVMGRTYSSAAALRRLAVGGGDRPVHLGAAVAREIEHGAAIVGASIEVALGECDLVAVARAAG